MTSKEALEKLNCEDWTSEYCEIVQKDLDVLEIIKAKNVDVVLIRIAEEYEEYNEEIACQDEWWHRQMVSEDEFDKLKAWLGQWLDLK